MKAGDPEAPTLAPVKNVKLAQLADRIVTMTINKPTRLERCGLVGCR